MRIFAMSDIHGCLAEFEQALTLVMEHLEERDTRLVLLGDYVHGGADSRGGVDKIMELQRKFGEDKVIALMGNHDEWVVDGTSTIEYMEVIDSAFLDESGYDDDDDCYIEWIARLPRYYQEGNTIFVHAGIEEEAGDMWEWGTSDDVFVGKYPAETGEIPNLEMKVVAGHVGTSEISGDPRFHDIFYDGASHYYIDGTVLSSGMIPVLMVDTDEDKYYRVTESGMWVVQPYYEEE